MSTHTKYPLQKADTPPDSSESHSDSEVNKAEENLEHLKIEESQSKDDSDESKPLDYQNKEGTSGKRGPLNEPIAGPSGHQNPHADSSSDNSDSLSPLFADPEKERDTVAKGFDKNIEARMVEGDSDTTNSTPPCIQSSTGITRTSVLQSNSAAAGPSRLGGEVDYAKLPINVVVTSFMPKLAPEVPLARRYNYATDSAHTSADISEIRTEIVDSSAEASVYHDASESVEKESSPSYSSAVERQNSESSDANISELPEDSPAPATLASSVSLSTPSGEQGHRAYLAQLQREADARGAPISTSFGIGSTNQSEFADRQAWNVAGEIGYFRHFADDPNQDVSDQGGEPQPIPVSMENDPVRGEQQNLSLDISFEERVGEENRPRSNVSESEMVGCVARRIRVEESVLFEVGAGSPSKRRKPSKYSSDSSREEKGVTEKPKLRFKPLTGKRSKESPNKSKRDLQSSSESPEPKSSSSDELRRMESPEIKSSSESQEFPKFEKGKKSWQKSGLLRGMQLSTMSSKDCVIAEEEEDASCMGRKDSESRGTGEHVSVEMETTPEKSGADAVKSTEPSESNPSIESKDPAYRSEAEGVLKEHEHGQGFGISDFERSVGKSKREPKLSNSPPSDEKQSSPSLKEATSRPKKKARSDKLPTPTRRTRHDSEGALPKSGSCVDLQQSESTSTSEYSPSEEETAL